MNELPQTGLDALPRSPRPGAGYDTPRTMSQIRLAFLALGSTGAGKGREVADVRASPSLPLLKIGEDVARVEPLDIVE